MEPQTKAHAVDARTEWLPIGDIKPNPKNRNLHSEEQIERLSLLIKHYGWRHSLIISNQSGLLVVGHGRLLAAKKLKVTHVPVVRQDFESPEIEFGFAVSDNGIASWAELDLSGIHLDLPDLGPFDLDMLGIKGFELEPADGAGGGETKPATLADRFLVPPFSVLDARQGYWQDRKRQWLALGIQSELGRGGGAATGGSPEPLSRYLAGQPSTWRGSEQRKSGGLQITGQAKCVSESTLGAVPPNEKQILKRTGKYATNRN